MEMLTAALAVLCALLTLVLLIQRPSIWPVLLALVVAWGICMAAFRYQLRRWLSRWVRGDNFEKSKTKFSLEQLSQPTALLSGETVLWYNEQFRARLLGGQDMLTSRVQKVLPGLDLQQCRTQQGQLSGVFLPEQGHKAAQLGKTGIARRHDRMGGLPVGTCFAQGGQNFARQPLLEGQGLGFVATA